uniref:Uncharacterized protein n=1 Tax=Romanomermis culicivorax TaxID=13658 RepID=A0A915K331_ROMCU
MYYHLQFTMIYTFFDLKKGMPGIRISQLSCITIMLNNRMCNTIAKGVERGTLENDLRRRNEPHFLEMLNPLLFLIRLMSHLSLYLHDCQLPSQLNNLWIKPEVRDA